MTVGKKITKMRICSMDIKIKFGGEISFLTSVEKKGMKDRDKDAKKVKIGIWVIFSINSSIIHLLTQAKLYKPKRPN